ncbi:MAG: hypothetical protein L3J07_04770 [Candidatus Magasanikbacteria bacterium]|nr:hypothetical protein [Candidatus Magasanikbacteria bacterium]
MPEYIQGDNHFAKSYQVMKEVLRGDYVETPSRIPFSTPEDKNGELTIVCSLKLGNRTVEINEKQGVGTLHAFFLGLRSALFADFQTLKTVTTLSFKQESIGRQNSISRNPKNDKLYEFGFGVAVKTSLTIKNGKGSEFTFEKTSLDCIQAPLLLVLEAVLFFVNSEEAYRRARRRFADSKSDSGYIQDSILPTLTKNNDYRCIAKSIREEADKERAKLPKQGGIAMPLKHYND